MARIKGNTKFTIDGIHGFTVGDTKYTVSNGFVDSIDVWSPDKGKTYITTIDLKGHDWSTIFLRLTGDADMKSVITDHSTGDGGYIEDVILGNAGSVAEFDRTRADSISSWGDGVDKLTLGAAGANNVNLSAGNDVLTLGTGKVGSVDMGSGSDTVHLGSGGVGSIYLAGGNDILTMGTGKVDTLVMGDGNNTFTGSGGWVGSVLSFQGNDTVKMGATSADEIALGDGTNTFVGGSQWVGQLRAGNGDDTVIAKNGDIESINLGHGENVVNVTGSGWVGNILAYNDKDVVNITGTSQVGSINLGKGNNIIHTGSNWVGSIITYEGNDTVTIGSGGAELVTMGAGKNTLVATGWVGTVQAYGGNDTVTLGSGGAGHVALYGGDDIVHVSEVKGDDGSVMLDGGKGNDTVDFGSFKVDVQISLSDPIEYVTDTAIFVVTGFENLITGSGKDELIGSSVANVLRAGKNNDDITGGGGADRFIFASGDGKDTVEDFVIKDKDVIDLSAVTQITSFADLKTHHMTQVNDDVRIADGAGDTITLKDVDMTKLTQSQFDFA